MAPKRNAFMTFALEWKTKYGKTMSTPEAVTAAGKIWEKMSREERDAYKEKGKSLPPLDSGKKKEREKLTCTGTPLSEVEQEERAAQMQEIEMKNYVSEMIRQSIADEDLEHQKHFFIAVNFFTKVLKENYYIPAEISLIEYSLKEGILRKYHTYVNPGDCFHGHHFEAKHHTETTHNLPLPPNAWGETQLLNVYKDILNFIRPEKAYAPLPPVYTTRDSMPIVESALAYLKLDDPYDRLPNVRVYSIQFLFGSLKIAACDINGREDKPASLYVTDTQFERDYFEYHSGISCEYHEKQDKSKYCSQSQATRWGYMFSEYICTDLGISMIAGRHVPLSTNLKAIITPAPTPSQSEMDIETASFVSFKSLNTSCVTAPIGDVSSIDGMSFKYKPLVNSTELDRSNHDQYPSLGKTRVATNWASMVKAELDFKSSDEDDDYDDTDKTSVAASSSVWTAQSVKAESQAMRDLSASANANTTNDFFDAKSTVSMSSMGRGIARGRGVPIGLNGSAPRFGRGRSALSADFPALGTGRNSITHVGVRDDEDDDNSDGAIKSSSVSNAWKHGGGYGISFK